MGKHAYITCARLDKGTGKLMYLFLTSSMSEVSPSRHGMIKKQPPQKNRTTSTTIVSISITIPLMRNSMKKTICYSRVKGKIHLYI